MSPHDFAAADGHALSCAIAVTQSDLVTFPHRHRLETVTGRSSLSHCRGQGDQDLVDLLDRIGPADGGGGGEAVGQDLAAWVGVAC